MGCSLLGGCRIVRVVRFNVLGGVLIFWGTSLVYYWVVGHEIAF